MNTSVILRARTLDDLRLKLAQAEGMSLYSGLYLNPWQGELCIDLVNVPGSDEVFLLAAYTLDALEITRNEMLADGWDLWREPVAYVNQWVQVLIRPVPFHNFIVEMTADLQIPDEIIERTPHVVAASTPTLFLIPLFEFNHDA